MFGQILGIVEYLHIKKWVLIFFYIDVFIECGSIFVEVFVITVNIN